MEIAPYTAADEHELLVALKRDRDWDCFTSDDAIDHYRARLRNGVTYVGRHEGEFCGYLRALLDEGLALYVSELYVVPAWRGRALGRTLLARTTADFPRLTVYILSDEDAYYEKLGYRRIGSVFQMQPADK